VLPTAIVGRLRPGLPFAGLPVVGGTMDAWSGLVGAGAAAEAGAIYLSGTSEILGLSSTRVIPTPGVIVFPDCAGVRMHAAPTQSGGDAAAWFAETQGISVDQIARLVAAAPRGPATPLFLPQLEGERAPLWNAGLRAAFLGVSRRTGQADLARAVYEGVAFAARWALEVLEASSGTAGGPLTCGGGGFRAEVWGQIRADVLGRDLRRLASGEPGVLGAATLAAIGSGAFAGFGEAFGALARFDRTFTPDPQRHARYSDLFELYKSAVTGIAGINSAVAEQSAGLG
jgi:xylulokinase